MRITGRKEYIKKIAIAVVLAIVASWSHEGFVVCYGADGHIEIERLSDKGCCKKQKKNPPATLSEQADQDHCVDVPLGALKYIIPASHHSSFKNFSIPLGAVLPPAFLAGQPCLFRSNCAVPQPDIPRLLSLKSTILRI